MLKLKVELIPNTSWGQSLRRLARQSTWNKLKKEVYAEYKHKCGICRVEGRLQCHEIWKYDDQKHIQKLVGFIALCDLCHSVKHLGRTKQISISNLDYYKMAVEHFMKVNACNRNVFEKHKKDMFTKWHERSQHEWEIDFGEYQNLFGLSVVMLRRKFFK
jgi:hypothetical protein